MTCAILLISTNRYKQFVQPVINGIEKNFLPNQQVSVHLFTDVIMELQTDRLVVHQHIIPSYRFPEATLLRFKIFAEFAHHIAGYDYLVYSDVDMEFCDTIREDFLAGDIIAVRHPGFWYNNGWGSGGNNPESLSYLAPELCKKYFCGGVQGGRADKYLTICKRLAEAIDNDTMRGVQAIYHDETFWNSALNWFIPLDYPDWVICEHTPEYCSVPEPEQRELWGIAHITPKIIALTKNHAELRG